MYYSISFPSWWMLTMYLTNNMAVYLLVPFSLHMYRDDFNFATILVELILQSEIPESKYKRFLNFN